MSGAELEAGVRAALAAAGLEATTWSNGPGDTYAEHRHVYDKVLVATDGSITFRLPERDGSVTLQPGDRLDLPAGTLHGADVGPAGVTCLEAHLDRGALAGRPLLTSGWLVRCAKVDRPA